MHLLTRAEFRDNIRRKLGIVPPVDIPGSLAISGQQPSNYPYPTNAQINDALTEAVSDLNRACGFHILQFTVPVAAQPASALGSFVLDLTTLTPNTGSAAIVSPAALINDVRRVLWVPSGANGVPVLLTPGNRNSIDRDGVSDYWTMPPSALPQTWWLEGYALNIIPAQSQAGQLVLTCGTGITGLQCEDDTLDQLPLDYQPVVEYQAIVRIAKTQTMNVEAMERAQMFGADAERGLRQLKGWVEGNTGVAPTYLGFASYRRGYGTRRTVR